MWGPPEYSLNDGETLGYDKNIDAGYKLPSFLIASAPKEKRPPRDTVMVSIEGLLKPSRLPALYFFPVSADGINRVDLG